MTGGRGPGSREGDPAQVIDTAALAADLATVAESAGPGPAGLRTAALERLKRALAEGRAEIRRDFEGGAGGAAAIAATSALADAIVENLFAFAATRVYPEPNPLVGERIAVMAVGGYGRAELAPYSDIDLQFLLPYKPTPWVEQVVEFVLYVLWDLGLKVGHATRSVDECVRRARADMTIRTGVLESRLVAGDAALCAEVRRRFLSEVVAGTGADFVRAKMAERDRRHKRMGDSRYVLEPNVKDGKGGLRDLHTLFWIAKYLYRVDDVGELVGRGVFTAKEYAKFVKARDFLWTVRAHLHYLSGRAEDRLTFDLQPAIARRLHYADRATARGVERFMKHYFLVAKDVGDLTRIFCAALEDEQIGPVRQRRPRVGQRRRALDGFVVDGGRLTIPEDDAFAKDPVKLIRLFHVAQAGELDIHPRALRFVTQNLRRIDARLRAHPGANRLFMEILTSGKNPEATLRRMNEAGVLGRFIPDFGRVVAQTQHDMYHVYTVDEHSIIAIGNLARIEHGKLKDELPLATEVVGKILSHRALYLGVLLHDVAKGRGGDHSEIGAQVARELGPRLRLTGEETETVAWLVRHHLLFSDTAFKRDLNDAKTVRDFVYIVQSLERLRLLLVLTAADIRAVGPHVWNGWKATLLRELYRRAEEVITGGHEAEAKRRRVEAAKARLRAALADWPAAQVEAYLKRNFPPYWVTFDDDAHLRHARLVCRAEREGSELAVDTRVDRARAVTEVTVFAPDQHGFFAKVAGAMALAGASIVDAKIFTTSDGKALDSFWIQDASGGPFTRRERLARLKRFIARALAGELKLASELARRRTLPSRAAVFEVEPRVLIDNQASTKHTVIEVNGRDRPGLLYDVTRALSELDLSIVTAHISTYGERAVDVFYVKDIFGLKVTRPANLDAIRARLLVALRGSGPRAAAPKLERPGAAASPA
ncbi:MAG: [protein-PII] uridylyltransferase [Alphaproteobacteria bacterium]